MGNKSLHELSRQYTEGELNKPEYRQQRTDLINEITGDRVPPETKTSDIRSHQPATGGFNPILKIAAIVVVFFVVIVLVYISRTNNDGKTTSTSSSNVEQKLALTATALQTQIDVKF